MGTIMRYQLSGSERSLQPVETTKRQPVARIYAPRDVKRSAVSMILEHGRSMREAQLRLGRKVTGEQYSEREILEMIFEHLEDRQEQAIRATWETAQRALRSGRGPQGPGPTAPTMRRAA